MNDIHALPRLETTLGEALFHAATLWDADLQVYAIHDAAGRIISVGQGSCFWRSLMARTSQGRTSSATPLGRYLQDHWPNACFWPLTVYYTPEGMSSDELERGLRLQLQPYFDSPADHPADEPRLPVPLPEPSSVCATDREVPPFDSAIQEAKDAKQSRSAQSSAASTSAARMVGWLWRAWERRYPRVG